MLSYCASFDSQCTHVIQIVEKYSNYIRCQGNIIFNRNVPYVYTGGTRCAVDQTGLIYISVDFLNTIEVITPENKLCYTIHIEGPECINIHNDELYVVCWDDSVQSNIVHVYSLGKIPDERQLCPQLLKKIVFENVIFGHIDCACILPSDEFVISDWSDEIKFFSKSGLYLRGFVIHDATYDDITIIKYICVKNDLLFVSKNNSTDIFIFTLDCKLVKIIHFDDLCNANQFAISSINELFVPNWFEDKICVYDLQGNCLRTFTSPEMYRPYGIGVLPHGEVVVSGYNMHSLFR